jgi:hypothetical protein
MYKFVSCGEAQSLRPTRELDTKQSSCHPRSRELLAGSAECLGINDFQCLVRRALRTITSLTFDIGPEDKGIPRTCLEVLADDDRKFLHIDTE